MGGRRGRRIKQLLYDVKETRRYYMALQNIIEGKIEGTVEVGGRRGRRIKQLLDDVKETRRLVSSRFLVN